MSLYSEKLQYLKFDARRFSRVGNDNNHSLSLLKFPISIQGDEEAKEIRQLWFDWWNSTESARILRVKWNSAARTSTIWLYFSEAAEIITGHPYVYCIQCGSLLQHPNYTPIDNSRKAIGASHLTNHRTSKSCQKITVPLHPQLGEVTTKFFRTSHDPQTLEPVPIYCSENFEQELVRVVLDNNWSFRTVERPSFRRFIQFLRPSTVMTNRYNFDQMCDRQFAIYKAKQLEDLGRKTKLSIALDAWSANNHLSFLAVKGYYINQDWQLRDVLIDFLPIRGKHTGENMATEVFKVLSSTKTSHRFLALTCDSARNNHTLASSLQEKLRNENIQWDPAENTIPCLAHIINLVVQDIIKHLKLAPSHDMEEGGTLQRRHIRSIEQTISVPNSLRKLRAIAIGIDRSPQRYERFLATQNAKAPKERLGVIRDVKTRWNSTYDMCERALKLRNYIDQWLQEEIALKPAGSRRIIIDADDTSEVDYRDLKRLLLSPEEWTHLKLITKLLANFKLATSALSKTDHPQIQYIWQMYNRLFDFLDEMKSNFVDESNEEQSYWPKIVENAAEMGRVKLSKYYGRTHDERGYLFNCATILDPTQKLTAYEDDTWDNDDKHIYRQQFMDYLERYDQRSSRLSTPSSRPAQRRSFGDNEWFRRPPPLDQSQSSSFSQDTGLQDMVDEVSPTCAEGEHYLSAGVVRHTTNGPFDLLGWWRANEAGFPRLARVARDILAIPIAEVGVEREFNIAKELIGARRHRLSARKIQQSMVLRNAICWNVRQTSGSLNEYDSTRGNDIDDLFEIEAQDDFDEVEVEELVDRCESTAVEENEEDEDDELRPPPRKRRLPSRYRDYQL